MRTWVIVIGVGLLAVIAFAFRPKPIVVETVSVSRGLLEESLDHEGRTRVRERYIVRSPLTGELARVPLEAGDAVTADETVLCAIDPPPAPLLDARSETEAKARISAAAAGVEEAREAVAQAEEQQRLAEREFTRVRDLSKEGDASGRELDFAEQALRRWEGDARRAVAAAKIAGHELEVARAAFSRSFGPEGGDAGSADRTLRMRAPISGEVLRVMRESAGPIAAGEPILEIGDVTALEIVADYLTTDAVRIAPGMRAWIHGWGGEEALPALVRRVEPSAYTKISALGVEEQRVDVVLDLETPGEVRTLKDGYRVEVGVIAWRGDDVVLAPEGALFRSGEGWAVFRVEEGRARLTPVRIGHRDGLQAEIQEGLRVDETVIVHPSDSVADGARVSY